jgi:deoxyribose-phosphate aldolase
MKNNELAKRILPLIDLTSLNESDDEHVITLLCKKAVTLYGQVAAVCIYPQFVALAKKLLANTNVKIATVSNFPKGQAVPNTVYAETEQAIKDGADEIDLVIPYSEYLTGKRRSTIDLVKDCKKICEGKALLKVILETGILALPENILAGSLDAIFAGADFLKTSTGKVAINATTEAAKIMLVTIRAINEFEHKNVGFKAAGGIRTIDNAREYLEIADKIMGPAWVTPKNFRFGASGLLDNILSELSSNN